MIFWVDFEGIPCTTGIPFKRLNPTTAFIKWIKFTKLETDRIAISGLMKNRFFLICALAYGLASCSDDDEISSGLNTYDRNLITYFNEVALGFEFGVQEEVTRKWGIDMKIFVGGDMTPAMMTELQKIITEINDLATDGFDMSIVQDSLQSNFYIFLGSGADYVEMYPSQSSLVMTNFALFSLYWDSSEHFYFGNMYVDIERADAVAQKHLLREELTQSLGLAKDSDKYRESIFYQPWTTTNEYANIDRDLIRLLYHPQMQVKLYATQVEAVLTDIILSEK
jgi:hypothetical protein